MQSAPYAVDVLEELMESTTSEPVRLKASSEILDRAGVRGGMDIGLDIEVTDSRSPAQIVQERLARLAAGAQRVIEVVGTDEPEIQDAEVVADSEETGADVPISQEPNNSEVESAAAAAPQEFLPSGEDDEDAAIQTEGFDEDEFDV